MCGYAEYIKADYCNNPADAWPIIDENNITIINDNPSLRFAVSEVAAYFNGSNHIWSAHKNGLRAAMIVFLKMQEPQNAKIPSERDS
ncbi:phage protein NinX family protein [Klebsiella pneumoniae]|uniref:phage protein NinX family protein n=1 Tax=Klebsiella pneumoniae TaxID=573 RepID=UPI0023637357|nr:phage protein NinX family protein [Klebsiella pneumoniae]